MTARLHVLLGAGGVGKTTLAAGYALALARAGRRVGLLGIDPALRLQGALGFELHELPRAVPGSERLHAALLRPSDSLRRWALETCTDEEQRQRLFDNPFFLAMADRLASATDVLAAVRVAEWLEHDPDLTDLVVDTAPGLGAVDFLRRPKSLAAFLEGRLVATLRWVARAPRKGPFGGIVRGSIRRVLGGLSRIGGTTMLLTLAEFLSLVEAMMERMLERLERAQRWLAHPSTELLLVTTVRDDAAVAAGQIAAALSGINAAPAATVVNRAVPATLGAHLAAVDEGALCPPAQGLLRYARAYAAIQGRVVEAVRPMAPALVVLQATRGLDEDERIAALSALGEELRSALVEARSRAVETRVGKPPSIAG